MYRAVVIRRSDELIHAYCQQLAGARLKEVIDSSHRFPLFGSGRPAHLTFRRLRDISAMRFKNLRHKKLALTVFHVGLG